MEQSIEIYIYVSRDDQDEMMEKRIGFLISPVQRNFIITQFLLRYRLQSSVAMIIVQSDLNAKQNTKFKVFVHDWRARRKIDDEQCAAKTYLLVGRW